MDRMMEFKDQSVEELKALFQDLTKEIYEKKNELRMTKKLEKPHLLKKKKRDRARILTLLSHKGEKI